MAGKGESKESRKEMSSEMARGRKRRVIRLRNCKGGVIGSDQNSADEV